ncbi:hypothetical protein KSP40_PGU021093 [Platanthera guangdongensis]|uniref:Uncharacterized protein n=1 Tax=Platanthera guangdongensis TaxID=2320717 RepID=A0ABR2M627_9ASPA
MLGARRRNRGPENGAVGVRLHESCRVYGRNTVLRIGAFFAGDPLGRSEDRKAPWKFLRLSAADMAQSKGLDEFEPIFGEAEPELEDGAAFGGAFRRPFLFYAHLLDSSHLEVLASDFHSHTFECVLTVLEIDDLVLLLTFNSLKQDIQPAIAVQK